MSSRTPRRPRHADTIPWVDLEITQPFKRWADRGRTTPLSYQEILDQQEVDEWDALVEAAKEDAWHRDDMAIEEDEE